MGQTALLFTNRMDPDRVRQMASVYGSSSPSYPMLVSLDAARDWLAGEEGFYQYRRAACRVAELRQKFPSLRPRPGLSLDPCRFVLKVKDGPAFAAALEERDVYPEMEDGGHVVFICTAQDSDEDFCRLERVLEDLEDRMGDCPPIPAPPIPERVLSPRQALFAPAGSGPWRTARGRLPPVRLPPILRVCPLLPPESEFQKKSWPICKK